MKYFIVLVVGLLWGITSNAGVKDDFIAAAKQQCNLSQDQAEKFATPGRKGTVISFKLCLKPEVKISDACTLKCVKGGSKVGQ